MANHERIEDAGSFGPDHVGMPLPAVDNVAVCAGQESRGDLEDALHANVVQLHVLTGAAVTA